MGFLRRKIFVLILLAVLLSVAIDSQIRLKQSACAATEVVYSQNAPDADFEIVSKIRSAKKYVYFAMYTITKDDIVSALIAAKLNGIDVRGIIDQSQMDLSQEKSEIERLQKFGIPLAWPKRDIGLMHIKMLITDSSYISGSFNWTVSASLYNDDIYEAGETESIRLKYLGVFLEMWKKYGGK